MPPVDWCSCSTSVSLVHEKCTTVDRTNIWEHAAQLCNVLIARLMLGANVSEMCTIGVGSRLGAPYQQNVSNLNEIATCFTSFGITFLVFDLDCLFFSGCSLKLLKMEYGTTKYSVNCPRGEYTRFQQSLAWLRPSRAIGWSLFVVIWNPPSCEMLSTLARLLLLGLQ